MYKTLARKLALAKQGTSEFLFLPKYFKCNFYHSHLRLEIMWWKWFCSANIYAGLENDKKEFFFVQKWP